MDLTKIMTISGKSGLYRLVATSKTGAIVESMVDLKRFPVFTHEKMSSLQEISVFTTGEDLPLKEVLKMMYDKEGGQPAIDPKSDGATLKKYFDEVIPTYDTERVYTSDMKKIIGWYNLLASAKELDFSDEQTEGDDPGSAEVIEDADTEKTQDETITDEQGNS